MSSISLFKKLSRAHPNPKQVQRFLHALPYNREKSGETVRSAFSVYERQEAHCLEACFLAAAILEQQGHPPQILTLDSSDNICHVVFLFKTSRGYGSVGRSREPGLHGREPVFKSIKALAMSYDDPMVDKTGSLVGYNVLNLDDSRCDWRASSRNVWKADRFTIEQGYIRLRPKKAEVDRLRDEYFKKGPILKRKYWW
jgi:hypothetical protein